VRAETRYGGAKRLLFTLAAVASVTVVAFAFAPTTADARTVIDGAESSAAAPAPAKHVGASHVILRVRFGYSLALRSRPFGPVLGRVGATTRFGSRRALGVLATRRSRWLAVTDPDIGGNRVVWVDARAGGIRYARTPLELDVALGTRTLTVRRNDRVVRRFTVAVGASASPTPTGRFAVTDKLDGARFSASYGCCILALSATQPNLPAGWTGGNRLAIHGAPLGSAFSGAVSSGCVRARERDLRYLMRVIRLGAPVVIRP
jgi:hypothetical protein